MRVVHHVRQAPDPFIVDEIVDRALRIGGVLRVRLERRRQVTQRKVRLRALGGSPDGPARIVRDRLQRAAVPAHDAQAQHEVCLEAIAGGIAAGGLDGGDGGIDLAELRQDEALA